MATAVKLPEDARINESVESAKKLIQAVAEATLSSYWKLGKLIADLDTDYGTSAVKQFAKKLTSDTNKELSESTLYRMRQFYERTPEEQLTKMIKSGIRWSHVVPTLSADPGIVDEVVEKVEAGELSPARMADAVRTAVEGDGVPEANSNAFENPTPSEWEDPGHPKGLDRKLKKCVATITSAVDALGDALILVDSYNKMSEDERKASNKDVKDLYDVLQRLSSAGGPVFKRLQEMLDK